MVSRPLMCNSNFLVVTYIRVINLCINIHVNGHQQRSPTPIMTPSRACAWAILSKQVNGFFISINIINTDILTALL